MFKKNSNTKWAQNIIKNKKIQTNSRIALEMEQNSIYDRLQIVFCDIHYVLVPNYWARCPSVCVCMCWYIFINACGAVRVATISCPAGATFQICSSFTSNQHLGPFHHSGQWMGVNQDREIDRQIDRQTNRQIPRTESRWQRDTSRTELKLDRQI